LNKVKLWEGVKFLANNQLNAEPYNGYVDWLMYLDENIEADQ
jgi:hypothetical protein